MPHFFILEDMLIISHTKKVTDRNGFLENNFEMFTSLQGDLNPRGQADMREGTYGKMLCQRCTDSY